jgi:HD-GYP domain-containing protein (c-di-GMP phosphodiesterase class II)
MLAEQLVGEARTRRKERMDLRERLVDNAAAVAFLAVAFAIAVILPSERSADPLLMIGLTVGYAVMWRVRFEYASFSATSEQIALIAMLVLLPLPLVPLLVAAGHALGAMTELTNRTRHRERWVTSIGECWFVIGPVLVLAALAPHTGTFADADVYLLAFAAQIACEVGWALIRDRGLMGHSTEEVLRTSAETSQIDAILGPLGFVVAVAAAQEPLALLTILPLVWMLELFSRDRRAKYSATLELNRAYRGTVMLLGDVIEYDDKGTGAHSRSVVDLVRAVAEEMKIDEQEGQELDFAALLHDVGKIVIPKEILNKPAALTDDEFEVMKTHTIEGQFLLDRIGGMLGRVGEVVRSCHERWDGLGYPDGLMGKEIPLASRIVFPCDAYNAMTSDRPYRNAMSKEAALMELHENAGTQFDPVVVEALTSVVGQIQPAMPAQAEIRALLSAASATHARATT